MVSIMRGAHPNDTVTIITALNVKEKRPGGSSSCPDSDCNADVDNSSFRTSDCYFAGIIIATS